MWLLFRGTQLSENFNKANAEISTFCSIVRSKEYKVYMCSAWIHFYISWWWKCNVSECLNSYVKGNYLSSCELVVPEPHGPVCTSYYIVSSWVINADPCSAIALGKHCKSHAHVDINDSIVSHEKSISLTENIQTATSNAQLPQSLRTPWAPKAPCILCVNWFKC